MRGNSCGIKAKSRIMTTDFPVRVAAPGRVNVIGEHTDYNEGYALPLALPHRVTVQARPRTDAQIQATSTGHGSVTFPLTTTPAGVTAWGGDGAGVVGALTEAGAAAPGAELAPDSAVPRRRGLCSCAAPDSAVVVARHVLAARSRRAAEAPRRAQRAEHACGGSPTGSMDQ